MAFVDASKNATAASKRHALRGTALAGTIKKVHTGPPWTIFSAGEKPYPQNAAHPDAPYGTLGHAAGLQERTAGA